MMLSMINIQSFSDIITNSSSELFCTISGSEDISSIFSDIIEPLFPGEDTEISPAAYYDEETNTISITLPYGIYCDEFYKAGLEAILGKYNNITIDYE